MTIDKIANECKNENKKRKNVKPKTEVKIRETKKKGSGAFEKEKNDKKEMEVHQIVFVCGSVYGTGTCIQLLSAVRMDLCIL